MKRTVRASVFFVTAAIGLLIGGAAAVQQLPTIDDIVVHGRDVCLVTIGLSSGVDYRVRRSVGGEETIIIDSLHVTDADAAATTPYGDRVIGIADACAPVGIVTYEIDQLNPHGPFDLGGMSVEVSDGSCGDADPCQDAIDPDDYEADESSSADDDDDRGCGC